MRLHVGFAEGGSGGWRPVAVFERGSEQTHGSGTLTWNCDVTLPTGEVVFVGAIYAVSNRGLNIVAKQDGAELVNVGGFKQKETSFDPSVIFRTIQGAYVQVMLGV
jgi:hypothetical protein